jgi:transglutaminase-like putative cysteine protease
VIENTPAHRIRTIILYVLGFLLLWEWLRPLQVVTDTGSLHYFLVFIALAMTLSYFRVKPFLSGPIKVLFILFSLQLLYFEGSFFNLAWIGYFLEEFTYNIGLTLDREWSSLSFMYRSLLFFILLWLMTYLLYYWLSVKKTILLFYIMTIVYISVLDSFSDYAGDQVIIRVVIFGFLLLGLLAFERIMMKERLLSAKMNKKRWIIPLVLMVGASSSFAFIAPKADPIWPDPVPYFKSYAEGTGNGVSKIGYDTDDSELGGPFIGDPTVVFKAEVESEHYWRIETKDVYTGKGWDQSSTESQSLMRFQSGEPVPLALNLQKSERELTEERILIEQPYNHVVYPYGVETVNGNEDGYFMLSNSNEKIKSYRNQEEIELNEYTITHREAVYSQKAMTAANDNNTDLSLLGPYLDRYTQLPETLPERVKVLAVEITEDKDNWYDKAKAIEQYFAEEAFVYDQFDVPVPEEGQDYVDQFLFETQRGYCDNFSTSMVVMMRSLGIPARWVKGYTEGEYQSRLDADTMLYEVSNNNAHSWVEVFFPEVGWVPFEPTAGFSNNVSYEDDLEQPETDETPIPETPEQEEQNKPLQPEKEVTTSGEEEFSLEQLWTDTKTFFKENWGKMLVGLALLLVLVAVLYGIRRRWLPYFLIFYYRRKNEEHIFSSAYISLMKQLERYGLKMEEGQTLRKYSSYIDSFFGTSEMTGLTRNYERVLYGQKLSEEDWEEMRELWENLIKRTTG